MTSGTRWRVVARLTGILLALGCGAPTGAKLLRSLAASPVVKCAGSNGQRQYNYVTLESGARLALSADDLPDTSRCVPVGTLFEKRRWELSIRLDGESVRGSSPANRIVPALAALGVLLVVVAGRFSRERTPD
jgi:hypothetical protein